MTKYFTHDYANPHAADHVMGWNADKAVAAARSDIAAAINCDPDEVFFTSGATEASNLAIIGLAARASAKRRRILISAIEHKCVLAAAKVAEQRFGCRVEVLPVDDSGAVVLEALQKSLREDVLMVSIMAVNNEIGTVQSLQAIAELSHGVGAILHTDAAQALSTGPFDVRSQDVETAGLSGHKIYGPKGIGALYVRRDVQSAIEPQIVGGDQQSGLRAGTVPVPLCAGLARAVQLMSAPEAGKERERIAKIRDLFAAGMLRLNSVCLNGPSCANRHPGNANMRFEGRNAQDLLARAQPYLAASTGSACNSGTVEASHVLRAIGLSEDQAMASIRFSFGRFSSETDATRAVEVMESL